MANLFLKSGGGNWSAAGTWSATSAAGVDSAGPPTAADDVIMELASGNCTIDSGAVCRSIDCDGAGTGVGSYAGTLTHTAGVTLTIGDGTAGAGNLALRFVSGMTYTLGNSATSAISFVSTSATVQTIGIDAKTLGNVTFNASSNGSWQFTSAVICNILTFGKGTLDTNGQSLTASVFTSSNTNVRTLTLGASSITLNGNSTTAWDITTATNMTLNANTSTITTTGTGTVTIQTGGLTYNNFVATGVTSGNTQYRGAFTCNNFTYNNTAGSVDKVNIGSNITITGTLTLSGTATTGRALFASSVIGTTRTVTCSNAPSLTNVDFQDITAAGAGGTWSGSSIGDDGGNSNITFTTAVTRYAVATGNWSATSTWAATSGGAPGATIPLCHDTVICDANSGNITVTMNIRRPGADIDFTGFTGTLQQGALNVFPRGSFTLSSGMTFSTTAQSLSFQGRGTHTITSAGKTFPITTFNNPSGSYTLQDALNLSSNALTANAPGTFATNGFNVTAGSFSGSVSAVLTLGASVITLTGTSGTIWSATSTIMLDAGTSEIILNGGGASTKTFSTGSSSLQYNKVTFSGSGTGAFITVGSVSTHTLAADTPPHTIQFTAGSTITVNTWSIRGVSGSIFTLESTSAGTAWNLSKTGGKIVTDWISLKDSHAAGGARFYAGWNSTDVSGNTGWIFTKDKDTGFFSVG